MSGQVIRILVSGFEPFPFAPNHPFWIRDDVEPPKRRPAPNPSAWIAERIGVRLAESSEGRIEIRRLFPLPVTYGEAGAAVANAIRKLEPRLVLSFGLGSRSRSEGETPADAELELTAVNLRHDDKGAAEEGEPCRRMLPLDWPPSGEPKSWSDEDRAWLARFPDNGGLSCSNVAILSEGPRILGTDLDLEPLSERVAAVWVSGSPLVPLLDDDPNGAAGRFICNEVYYRALHEQKERNASALFVHLPPLDEGRKPRILAAADAILEGCLEQIR